MRRIITTAIVLLALGAALLLWLRSDRDGGRVAGVPLEAARTGAVEGSPHDESSPSAALVSGFPLAAELNAPDSTVARDLEVLSEILIAWRTNFPRQGNPVGLNSEITAALAGENRLGLVLVPKNHGAINSEGELCDRWGTPFRFHQISGDSMEIRSAGPDGKFGTADDVRWSPGETAEGHVD